MTDDERLIFLGLQAREVLLKQAADTLAADRRYACTALAGRLHIKVGDLGSRVRIDAQRGLVVELTDEDTHAD